jgi:hypothetical protein
MGCTDEARSQGNSLRSPRSPAPLEIAQDGGFIPAGPELSYHARRATAPDPARDDQVRHTIRHGFSMFVFHESRRNVEAFDDLLKVNTSKETSAGLKVQMIDSHDHSASQKRRR